MLLALLCALVSAQDIPKYRMEKILVIGERERIGLEPSAVIEIPDNSPNRSATLDEALKAVPGLVVARTGGPGQPSSLFMRGANSEHTLVLLDGVEINDASAPGGGFDFATLDMNLIERIEIYKGPQALRFGSGAMGGAINVITKKGEGPGRVIGTARGGSFATNQVSAAYLGGDERKHYALSVSRFESEGISASSAGEELDGHRYLAAALRAGSGGWELISRIASSFTDLDFAPSGVGPYFMAADDPNYHVNGVHTTSALSYSWARSRVLLGYDYTDRRYRDPVDLANASTFRDDRWAGTMKLENVNDVRLGDGTLTFGPSWRGENSGKRADIFGAFANYGLERGIFSGAIGGRVDHHSRFGTQATYQLAPSVRWGSALFTVKAATAFKSPSLFQIFDPTFGNEDLSPERVRAEELSVQKSIGVAVLGLSVFRYRYRDLIQFSSRYENLGAASAKGAEAELEVPFGESSRLEFAYTYVDTRNESTGARLLRRPLNSWRVGANLAMMGAVSVGALYSGQGSRDDIDALSAAPTKLGAHGTLDLSVNYQVKPTLQLTLSAENALDREYEQVAGYATPGIGVYGGVRGEIF